MVGWSLHLRGKTLSQTIIIIKRSCSISRASPFFLFLVHSQFKRKQSTFPCLLHKNEMKRFLSHLQKITTYFSLSYILKFAVCSCLKYSFFLCKVLELYHSNFCNIYKNWNFLTLFSEAIHKEQKYLKEKMKI